jgi:hypothetical protein
MKVRELIAKLEKLPAEFMSSHMPESAVMFSRYDKCF